MTAQCGIGFLKNEFRARRPNVLGQFAQHRCGFIGRQPARIGIEANHLCLGTRLKFRLHLRRQSVGKGNASQFRRAGKIVGND